MSFGVRLLVMAEMLLRELYLDFANQICPDLA